MPGQTPNEKVAILERRQKVAARYVRGEPQWKIAQSFEVDTGTICRDLKAIKAEWLAQAVMDMNTIKANQLAKIDAVELEAWKAWMRSQEDAKTRRERSREVVPESDEDEESDEGAEKKTSKRLNETEQISKGQAGNPRFLEIIQNCIKMRCAIFGIDAEAPTVIANVVTVINGVDLEVLLGRKLLSPETARVQLPYIESQSNGGQDKDASADTAGTGAGE